VTQDELTRVFGDQAYDPATVHQVITTDANGITSTSYQDKEGHVLATSLINTDAANDLEPLSSAANDPYQVTGHVDGDVANDYVTEATATFSVDPPGQTVTFNYSLTPSSIHDACGNYCATCDAQVDLFLVNTDDPSQGNLIDDNDNYPEAHAHRVTVVNGAACPEGGEVEPTTFLFHMDLPAGNYTLTRRITTNTQFQPSVGYEDHFVSDLTSQYNAMMLGQMGAAITALQSDPPDLDAALATGTVTEVNDGQHPPYSVVTWPIGCGTLTVPVNSCAECMVDSTTFLGIFNDQFVEAAENWNSAHPDDPPHPVVFTRNDLFAHLSLHGNTYSPTQFNALLTNIAGAYSCEELRNCWLSACITFTSAFENGNTTIDLGNTDLSELPGGGNGISGTMDLNLMDIFLRCAGRHLVRAATSTDDFLTHAYEASYYPDVLNSACHAAVDQALNAAIPPIPTDWGTPFDLPTDNGPVSTSGWELFENCMDIPGTVTIPPISQAQAAEMLDEQLDALKDECFQACYDKYDAYVDAVAALYPTANEAQQACYVNALLVDCYSDCNAPSVQYDQDGHATGIGTESELTRVQDILVGSFTLSARIGGTSCAPGSEPVDVALNSQPAFLLPTETDFPDVLNDAFNDLAPFIFQNFADQNGWHLVVDDVNGDVMEWTHPYLCLTLRVHLGLVAGQTPDPDCTECHHNGEFYGAACVVCGPRNTYKIDQVEVLIGNSTVFGARFSNSTVSLLDLIGALSSGEAFTTTYGKFVHVTAGIDFVRPNGTAWPTSGLPLYAAGTSTPILGLSLLHGNANAPQTIALSSLFNTNCPAVTSSCVEKIPPCITWSPGPGLDPDLADHIDLVSCEQSIASSYLEAINQHMAQVLLDAQNALREQYQHNCASPESIVDDLSYSYTRSQYQYTLYYYDRAGNLINTVAPGQVRTMEQDGVTDHALWATHHLDQHQRTTYVHNSLGQVVQQTTPNGGATRILLDKVGRPRITQDAQQATEYSYTYTKYDDLGRVVETGRSKQVPPGYSSIPALLSASHRDAAIFFVNHATFPTELPSDGLAYRTITTYTTNAGAHYINGAQQRFLQNRVSCALTDEDGDLGTTDDQVSTSYSYDPHGNVEWIVQKIPGLGLSYVGYDYDLVSGRVREVHYNEGRADQFFQRYAYDADGRILRAETSTDGVIWDKDASYAYYKHGPLKRTLVGEDEVQGTDHTYTLQGWLKGINDPRLLGSDAGRDGVTGQPNEKVARDAFGMVLGYYAGDFDRTGSAFAGQENIRQNKKLYNGNISGWGFTSQLSPAESSTSFTANSPLAFAYQYDELNRLLTSAALKWTTNWVSMGYKWGTLHSYDANGNILTTKRYNESGTLADNIGYNMPSPYTTSLRPDQLPSISESINNNSGDLKENHTYHYYVNGELKEDLASSLNVYVKQWDPYGKVRHIKSGTEHLRFLYDASGQRVAKAVLAHGSDSDQSFGQTVADGDEYTYYVRDAQGNILGTYVRHIVATPDPNDGNTLDDYVNLSEEAIYGSARLGMRLGDGTKLHEVFWVNGHITVPPVTVHPTSEVGHLHFAQLDGSDGTLYEHHTVPGPPITFDGDDVFKDVLGCADLYSAEDDEQNTLFTARTVLDANTRASLLYLNDRDQDPMLGSGSLKCDWRSGTLSASVPGKPDQYYLFTIGEDALPYVNIVDMSATTITQGEVISPYNTVLDNDAGHSYTGAMAVLDDRSGDGVSWLYLKYVDAAGLTHLEGVDLSSLANGGRPADYLHDLASLPAKDDRFNYDEIQLSPDLHYLAVADRLKPDIWADHLISLYSLSQGHDSLTLAGQYLMPATNISSLDFSPNGSYLYFTGSDSKGNYAYRIATADIAHARPEQLLKDAGDVRRTSDQNMLVTTPTQLWSISNSEGTTPVTTAVANTGRWHSGMDFLANLALQPLVRRRPVRPHGLFARALGRKRYELTDHLGNVRVVVTDRKLSSYNFDQDMASDFYAEVTSRTDYYPFGSLLPRRNYSADSYPFLFQGQLHDDELHGATGTSYAFKYRMDDSRLGRFLSIDPLAAKYPYNSPYAFSENVVINAVEFEGLEKHELSNGASVDGPMTDATAAAATLDGQGKDGTGSATAEYDQPVVILGHKQDNGGRTKNTEPSTPSSTASKFSSASTLFGSLGTEFYLGGILHQESLYSNGFRFGRKSNYLLTGRNFSQFKNIAMTEATAPASTLLKIGDGFGHFGTAAGGASVLFEWNDYNNGQVSGSRFAYHTTGTVAAEAVGFVVDAPAAMVVGGTFFLGEQAHDAMWYLAGQMSRIEYALNNGWRPH
jgi:RHS repeat-associated protein